MRENDRNSTLDARIDAALHTYAEPPAVPDSRTVALQLLERAREVGSRPARSLRRWAIPVAACLVALVLAAIWLLRASPAPGVARTPAPPQTVAQTHTPAPPVQLAVVPAHERLLHAVASKPQSLPKLAVFPTPTPLSPQERALVAFAEHGPPAVQRAVLQDQKDWNTPNTLAGLQPHPLPAANLQDQ